MGKARRRGRPRTPRTLLDHIGRLEQRHARRGAQLEEDGRLIAELRAHAELINQRLDIATGKPAPNQG